jgi:hypothetical protein
VIANVVCSVLRQYDWITPIVVFIVGVHFFPLGVIFRNSRSHIMAALFCLVVVLTVILVPRAARYDGMPAWFVWISLGCGPAAIWCGWGNTLHARRDLRELRRNLASA